MVAMDPLYSFLSNYTDTTLSQQPFSQAGSDGEGEGDAVDGEVDGEGEGEKGASTGGGGGRKGGKKGADVAGDEGADGEVKRGAKKRDREEAGVEEGDDGDGGALR